MCIRFLLQLAILLLLVHLAAEGVWAGTVALGNARIGIGIDEADGALVQLENRLTGDTKEMRSIPFLLVTSRGEVGPRDCRRVRGEAGKTSARFTFAGKGLEIVYGYQLVTASGNAVEMMLRVT